MSVAPMSEPQDQRTNNGTEESPAMTIEFLRARLLSERSVSRAAKLRAYELSRRVTELEEQLKIVSLQRKKAEIATVNVLAILENHGISDESEAFDSSSDQDESNNGNETGNGEETSDSIRVGDLPAYSSSEIEFSPSIGRSLSWKNSKHSLNSFERNNFMDSSRRNCPKSASFASSPKRVGKSCRRIRRREIRLAAEGSQKDSSTFHRDAPSASSEGLPNCHDIQPRASEEGSCRLKERDHLEDMEGALQNQEQLIGRYVAEEKAQREWEEKFTENKRSSPDSYDPGNHSDVTEERDSVKATVQPRAALSTEGVDVCSNEEVKMPKNLVSPPHVNISLQERESSSIITHESPALTSPSHHQSAVSLDVDNSSQKSLSPGSKRQVATEGVDVCSNEEVKTPKNLVPPPHVNISLQERESSSIIAHESPALTSPSHHQSAVSSDVDNSSQKSLSPGGKRQVALVPFGTTDSVGSVLEALQKAKFSLKHKVDGSQMVESGSSGDRVEIPPGCPGLFRLPIDINFETTSQANSLSGTASRLSISPAYQSHMVSTSSAVSTSQAHLKNSDAGLPSSTKFPHLDLQGSKGIPFTTKFMYPSYPFLPDVTPQLTFNNKDVGVRSASRASLLDDHKAGLPPSTHLSLYDHNIKPNFR